MPKRRENPIPVEHRQAVYYLGLHPDQIVSVRQISDFPMKFDVVLKKGELMWSGHVTAPDWAMRPPNMDIEDLINGTKPCPTCDGSGKVPKNSTAQLANLRTASAEDIDYALKKWRGWRLEFDLSE